MSMVPPGNESLPKTVSNRGGQWPTQPGNTGVCMVFWIFFFVGGFEGFLWSVRPSNLYCKSWDLKECPFTSGISIKKLIPYQVILCPFRLINISFINSYIICIKYWWYSQSQPTRDMIIYLLDPLITWFKLGFLFLFSFCGDLLQTLNTVLIKYVC